MTRKKCRISLIIDAGYITKYIFLEIHVSLYLLLYLDTLVKRDLIFPSFLPRMKFLK